MIRVSSTGKHADTVGWLTKLTNGKAFNRLSKYGEWGVKALSAATPKETGETASSWDYVIEKDRNGFSITWINSHKEGGDPVAILIQYGHGTGTGGYVQPVDYVNPAMKPVLDRISEDLWKQVKRV